MAKFKKPGTYEKAEAEAPEVIETAAPIIETASEVAASAIVEAIEVPPQPTVEIPQPMAPPTLEERLAAFRVECEDIAQREGCKLIGQPYTAWTMEHHTRAQVRIAVKKMVDAFGTDTLFQKVDAGYTIMQDITGRIFRRMGVPRNLREIEWHNGTWCFLFDDPKNSKTHGTETGWKPIKEYDKWTQR